MKKYLSNKEMAQAFGGYDFKISDMRNVCKSQRELTLKQVKKWLESLPIEPSQRFAYKVDLEIILEC